MRATTPAESTERNFELGLFITGSSIQAAILPALSAACGLPEKLTDIDGKAFDRISQFFCAAFTLTGENLGAATPSSAPRPISKSSWRASLSADPEAAGGKPRRATVGLGGAEGGRARNRPSRRMPDLPATPRVSRPIATAEFEKRMQPGKAYEVSFLSIEIDRDVADRSDTNGRRLRRHRRPSIGLSRNWSARHRRRATAARSSRGRPTAGLLIFWSSRSYDHAIMTGLKVLHSLPVFNLDPKQNPLAVQVKTRTAAHDAVIIFKLPSSDISSEDLDFVVELQRQNTDAGGAVDHPSGCSNGSTTGSSRISNTKSVSRASRSTPAACRRPTRGPREANLEDLTRKLKQKTAQVREILAIPSLRTRYLGSRGAVVPRSTRPTRLLNKYCSLRSATSISEWPSEMFLGELAAADPRDDARGVRGLEDPAQVLRLGLVHRRQGAQARGDRADRVAPPLAAGGDPRQARGAVPRAGRRPAARRGGQPSRPRSTKI